MTDTRFNVRIGAKDETKAAVQSAQGGFSALTSSVGKFAIGLGVATVAITGAVRAMQGLTSEYIRVGDELGKMSLRLGVSAEALDTLSFVAERQGVSFSQVTVGLQQMTRNLQDAAAGTGEAKDAIDKLGISAQSLARMSIDEQFRALAEAIAKLDSESEQVAVSMDIFGRSGAALNQIFAAGPGVVGELSARYQELGGFTDDMAKRAEKAADHLTDLSKAVRNAKAAIADELLQSVSDSDIKALTDMFVAIGKSAGKTIKVSIEVARFLGVSGPGGQHFNENNPYLADQLNRKLGSTPRERRLNALLLEAGNLPAPNVAGLSGGAGQRGGVPVSGPAAGPGLDLAGFESAAAMKPVVEMFQAARGSEPSIRALTDTLSGPTDFRLTDYVRDAQTEFRENIRLTQHLGEQFGANVMDAAFRAADAWAYFAADAIVYGGNVFDALKEGMRGFLADTLGLLAQRVTRSFVAAVLPLIPVVGPLFKEAASGAPPAGGFSGAPPVAFAGSAPSNVNINVTTTFGTRSEAIQVAERVAGAMVEGGFMRRAF